MTVFTDYLITVVAGWFGLRLLASARKDANRSQLAWAISFLFTGLAALLGGSSHGFVSYLDDAWMNLIWKGATYSIGVAMVFAVAGTLRGTAIGTALHRPFSALNILGFAIYAIWIATHDRFLFVIIYYLSAMVFIAALQIWASVRHHAAGAKWLISGVIVTLISAYIQQSDIDLHANFNHNDLYHVVQIAGLYLLYRGAKLLVDRDRESRQDPGSGP